MFLKIETTFFLNLTFYFSRKRNYFSSEFKNISPEIEITHIFPEIEKNIRKLSGPRTLPYRTPEKQSFCFNACPYIALQRGMRSPSSTQ